MDARLRLRCRPLAWLLTAAAVVTSPAYSTQAEPAAPPPGTADGESELEWLEDEKTGQQYRIEKIPRREGIYRWLDEEQTRITYLYGMLYDVVDHDDDWFWVKVWRSVKRAPPSMARPPEEVAAERAAIAASYRSAPPTVDRLRLEPFDRGLPRNGQWRQAFDLADMNGDGRLDIVSGPPRKSARPLPQIFLGDGEGTWRRWSEASFPPLPYDYGAAAAGDLDGDKIPDLVLGVHLRGILALRGDAGGRFREWRSGIAFRGNRTEAAEAFSSRSVSLVDWNGDGRLDILALGEGPQMAGRPGSGAAPRRGSRGLLVYLNRGDGSWSALRPAVDSPLALQFGDDLTLGDFDGDGHLDIALASRILGVSQILGLADDGRLRAGAVGALRPHAILDAVEAADLDGDGRSELFVAFRNRDGDDLFRTGIDLLSGGPEGEWRRRSLFAGEGRHGIYSLDSGDLDGDGAPDLVALTGDGELLVLVGGDAGFALELSPELPEAATGCRGYDVRLADLGGDAAPEIVAAFAGEPGGLPGAPGATAGCPGEGSLRAWTAKPQG